MNPDQTMAIRVAIRDTCDQLRPPVMDSGLPEPTRTALQAHLDALLKEELRALTGQALDGDLAVKADGSGEWVDLPGPPIHVTTVVCARAEDGTILPPLPIGYLDLDSQHALPDLVAYKVVKP